jgi:hypothetical protein
MNDEFDSRELHPHIALLLRQYARDLAQITPSSDLDARIGALVAAGREKSLPVRRTPGFLPYAAAAGLGALAIGVGIYIGMKLEQSRDSVAANASGQAPEHEGAWSSADLTMWPSDSVSFQIPAEFSAQGKLVAVDPNSKNTSTRYWIDVVVSNDGTFRIERVVPADSKQADPGKGGHEDAAPKIQ